MARGHFSSASRCGACREAERSCWRKRSCAKAVLSLGARLDSFADASLFRPESLRIADGAPRFPRGGKVLRPDLPRRPSLRGRAPPRTRRRAAQSASGASAVLAKRRLSTGSPRPGGVLAWLRAAVRCGRRRRVCLDAPARADAPCRADALSSVPTRFNFRWRKRRTSDGRTAPRRCARPGSAPRPGAAVGDVSASARPPRSGADALTSRRSDVPTRFNFR